MAFRLLNSILLFCICCIAAPSTYALDASDFSGLEGWTVSAVTSVTGEFNGCDYDKRIHFANGWVLTCSEYSYNYSYQPDAVIFSKAFPYKGKTYLMVKVLIEDEFYEVNPIPMR